MLYEDEIEQILKDSYPDYLCNNDILHQFYIDQNIEPDKNIRDKLLKVIKKLVRHGCIKKKYSNVVDVFDKKVVLYRYIKEGEQ